MSSLLPNLMNIQVYLKLKFQSYVPGRFIERKEKDFHSGQIHSASKQKSCCLLHIADIFYWHRTDANMYLIWKPFYFHPMAATPFSLNGIISYFTAGYKYNFNGNVKSEYYPKNDFHFCAVFQFKKNLPQRTSHAKHLISGEILILIFQD